MDADGALLDSKCEQTFNDESTGAGRSLIEDFRILLEEMSAFAKTQGINIVPYKSSNLPFYSALPRKQQRSVYKGLRAYYEAMIVTHTSSSKLSVAESTAVMLSKLDLKYDDDYLATLTNEHVVEVYLIESLQVYRNLFFFTLTSYALEEICTRPWFELWERDSRVTELLLTLVGQLNEFKITGAVSVLMPTHEVRDHASRLRAGALMSPMTILPLYDKHGAVYGFATSYKINPVG